MKEKEKGKRRERRLRRREQEDEDAAETAGAKIGVEEAYQEQVEDDSLFLEKE